MNRRSISPKDRWSMSLHAHGLRCFSAIFLNEKLKKRESTTKVCLQNVNQTTNDNLPFNRSLCSKQLDK